MATITRRTGRIDARIGGLILALSLMAVGCTQAFARYGLFERSDLRIRLAVESAQRMCQKRQPKNVLPSRAEYERCVLEALRGTEVTPARQ